MTYCSIIYIFGIVPKYPYKPKINEISKKLMMRKESENKKKSIWESLYDLDKELTDKRDQIHLEKKLKDANESLNECTFKPKLKAPEFYQSIESSKESVNLYQRNMEWKRSVTERYQ